MTLTMHVLGLTVVAALVSFVGNLIALYLKDFLGARSFERWKAKESLAASFDRYRKPIFLAAEEFGGRCYSIAINKWGWPRDHIGLDVLKTTPGASRSSSITDEHYYRLTSDAYRLCCFLGWIELYRRDLGLLDTGAEPRTHELDNCIKSVRRDFASSNINPFPDSSEWLDAPIFREEQRAIGQRMIMTGQNIGLIDFGTFCEQLDSDPSGMGGARWFLIAVRFFSNLREDRDFRLIRMRRLVVHLTQLREVLRPSAVRPDHLINSQRLASELVPRGLLENEP